LREGDANTTEGVMLASLSIQEMSRGSVWSSVCLETTFWYNCQWALRQYGWQASWSWESRTSPLHHQQLWPLLICFEAVWDDLRVKSR